MYRSGKKAHPTENTATVGIPFVWRPEPTILLSVNLYTSVMIQGAGLAYLLYVT
jgi:hypothetical protein